MRVGTGDWRSPAACRPRDASLVFDGVWEWRGCGRGPGVQMLRLLLGANYTMRVHAASTLRRHRPPGKGLRPHRAHVRFAHVGQRARKSLGQDHGNLRVPAKRDCQRPLVVAQTRATALSPLIANPRQPTPGGGLVCVPWVTYAPCVLATRPFGRNETEKRVARSRSKSPGCGLGLDSLLVGSSIGRT